MKLRPLHDRVIVKRLESETKTASGIVIPDNAAEKPDQGEILAVGPGKKNDKGDLSPVGVKVGDRVLFGKYSGQTVGDCEKRLRFVYVFRWNHGHDGRFRFLLF